MVATPREVCIESTSRCDELRLQPWPDVDTADELRPPAREVRGDPNSPPAAAAWLGDHGTGVETAI
jgi:hypothetical protein